MAKVPYPGLLITVGTNVRLHSVTTLLPTPPCGPAVLLLAKNSSSCPLHIPAPATVTDTCQPLVPSLFKEDERGPLQSRTEQG